MTTDDPRPTASGPSVPAGGPRSRRRAAVVMVGAAMLAIALAACGTSGRALRDPAPGATAPPRKADGTVSTTTTTTAVIDTTPETTEAPPVASLSISSPAWASGEAIPVEFTCQGDADSPPLTIEGVPAGTAELLLLVRDTNDDGYLQWVVAGIAPADPSFPAGSVPPGAEQLYNDGDVTSWRAPCPPAGTGRHTYEFTVYALTQPSGLGTGSSRSAILAVADSAASSASVNGTYARG